MFSACFEIPHPPKKLIWFHSYLYEIIFSGISDCVVIYWPLIFVQADKDKLAVLTIIMYFDKEKVTYSESQFLILDVFYICSKLRISITKCNGQ